MTNELHEECGVFGIYAPHSTDVATAAYYGLFALQHRGQESCGISVNSHGVFSSHKDVGLVNEVFTKEVLDSLGQGNIAVGACALRYHGRFRTHQRPSPSLLTA